VTTRSDQGAGAPPGLAAGDRRLYNRRRGDADDITSPYLSVFERIAIALEQLADQGQDRPITIPPRDERP
jgi:hypothetical protein